MYTILTALQAFKAMTKFLDNYYNKTLSDDVGSLLSGMLFLQDGCTADPAMWKNWIDALKTERNVTTLQAFNAMRRFLDAFYKRTSSSSADLRNLLDSMKLKNGEIQNLDTAKLWTDCINEALEGSISFLELRK